MYCVRFYILLFIVTGVPTTSSDAGTTATSTPPSPSTTPPSTTTTTPPSTPTPSPSTPTPSPSRTTSPTPTAAATSVKTTKTNTSTTPTSTKSSAASTDPSKSGVQSSTTDKTVTSLKQQTTVDGSTVPTTDETSTVIQCYNFSCVNCTSNETVIVATSGLCNITGFCFIANISGTITGGCTSSCTTPKQTCCNKGMCNNGTITGDNSSTSTVKSIIKPDYNNSNVVRFNGPFIHICTVLILTKIFIFS